MKGWRFQVRVPLWLARIIWRSRFPELELRAVAHGRARLGWGNAFLGGYVEVEAPEED